MSGSGARYRTLGEVQFNHSMTGVSQKDQDNAGAPHPSGPSLIPKPLLQENLGVVRGCDWLKQLRMATEGSNFVIRATSRGQDLNSSLEWKEGISDLGQQAGSGGEDHAGKISRPSRGGVPTYLLNLLPS